MRELTKLLKVLSDESRLRVLNLLQERECCVCEVMQVMDISQSKASRILRALYDTGVLKLRREGRWALYSIDTDRVKDYAGHILTGIKHSLESNPVALEDLERLKKAERIGPACVAKRRAEQPAKKFLRQGVFQDEDRVLCSGQPVCSIREKRNN